MNYKLTFALILIVYTISFFLFFLSNSNFKPSIDMQVENLNDNSIFEIKDLKRASSANADPEFHQSTCSFPSGRTVVVMEEDLGAAQRLKFTRYNPDGTRFTNYPILINSAGSQRWPHVDCFNGTTPSTEMFVVVWTRPYTAIMGTECNFESGICQSEYVIDDGSTCVGNDLPSVAILDNMELFVVTWFCDQGGSVYSFESRRINSGGTPANNQITTRPSVGSMSKDPAIAALQGGDYVISTISAGVLKSNVYDQDNVQIDDYQVNDVTNFATISSNVIGLNDGGFIVVWFEDDGGVFKAYMHRRLSNSTSLIKHALVDAVNVGVFDQKWTNVAASNLFFCITYLDSNDYIHVLFYLLDGTYIGRDEFTKEVMFGHLIMSFMTDDTLMFTYTVDENATIKHETHARTYKVNMFECNGLKPYENGVCNSRGDCVSTNVCENCVSSRGNDCEEEETFCNGESSFSDDSCSGTNGVCSEGHCYCSVNYYGSNCQEYVPRAFFASPDKVIVEYVVNASLVTVMSENSVVGVQCQSHIMTSLANSITCSWTIDNEKTTHLSVESPPSSGSSFRFRNPTLSFSSLNFVAVTNDSEFFTVNIEPYVDFTWVIYIASGVAAVIIFLLILIICVVVCIIGCFVIFRIRKLEKKLAKVKKLDEHELQNIIDEKEAQLNTGEAKLVINKKLFVIDFDAVKIVDRLGSGGSDSEVFLAKWQGNKVGYKIFSSICSGTQKSYEEFEKEVAVMSSTHHPNILQFYGASLKEPRIGIVMEYCENGDLVLYYAKNKKRDINLKTRMELCVGICAGMAYLHSNMILHRDLKSQNVLITKAIVPKICDFGLSRFVKRMDDGSKTRRIGTSHYMAPEMTLGKDYTEKADVFSFAIMAWEIFHHNFLPYGKKKGAVELSVANDNNFRPVFLDEANVPSEVKDIIIQCWSGDPLKRRGFSQLRHNSIDKQTPKFKPQENLAFSTLLHRTISRVDSGRHKNPVVCGYPSGNFVTIYESSSGKAIAVKFNEDGSQSSGWPIIDDPGNIKHISVSCFDDVPESFELVWSRYNITGDEIRVRKGVYGSGAMGSVRVVNDGSCISNVACPSIAALKSDDKSVIGWYCKIGSTRKLNGIVMNLGAGNSTTQSTFRGNPVAFTPPGVAALENGGYVFTSHSTGELRASIHSENGDLINEFLVNDGITVVNSRTNVAALANGDFIVAWVSYDSSIQKSRIVMKRFTFNGDSVGEHSYVNPFITNVGHSHPFIASSHASSSNIEEQLFCIAYRDTAGTVNAVLYNYESHFIGQTNNFTRNGLVDVTGLSFAGDSFVITYYTYENDTFFEEARAVQYVVNRSLSCNGELFYSSNVCSSHGICIDHNECSCIGKFMGDDCEIEIFNCGGISSIDSNVCSSNGNCINNKCYCNDKHYGVYCEENVKRAYFISHNAIMVDYIVNKTFVSNDTSGLTVESCDCSQYCQTSLNDFAECSWIIEDDFTTQFRIEVPATVFAVFRVPLLSSLNFPITMLTFKSITNQSEIFQINVEAFVDDIWIFYVSCASVIIILILVVIIICVIICIIALFVCVRMNKMSKRLSKVKKLDDHELQSIIEEKEASLNTEEAKITVNTNLFKIDFDSVKVVERLGKGGSDSEVFRATWQGNDVAYKIFNTICSGSSKDYEDFEKEVSVMSSIHHPNILQFFGASLKEPRVGIVMEYCENGDLVSFYSKKSAKEFGMIKRLELCVGICAGMAYLHSNMILHRDLKSQNVLVTKAIVPKICDFGLSRFVQNMEDKKTKRVGTSHYMAPEMSLGKDYSEKADVFSFAIMCWEIFHHTFFPYGKKDSGSVQLAVANDEKYRPVFSDEAKVPSEVKKIVETCWSADPIKRRSFEQLRVFFKKLIEILQK